MSQAVVQFTITAPSVISLSAFFGQEIYTEKLSPATLEKPLLTLAVPFQEVIM
jgi:hypothetical protein